uniref:Anaphase-promoting complex subunit 10 n=1 Tax=Steinernema glaseri TaxID=37863 RepID=A0A1I7Y9G7_9BILA
MFPSRGVKFFLGSEHLREQERWDPHTDHSDWRVEEGGDFAEVGGVGSAVVGVVRGHTSDVKWVVVATFNGGVRGQAVL